MLMFFLHLGSATTFLGGNAPVMANRFTEDGCRVLLGATSTSDLRKQLHPDIQGELTFTYC